MAVLPVEVPVTATSTAHVRHGGVDEARFVRAFESEIAATKTRIGDRTVSTNFLRRRHAFADENRNRCRRFWIRSPSTGSVAPDVEVTLEPTRPASKKSVSRLSLSRRQSCVARVQALDDQSLKELGRLHTAQEALDAVAIARAASTVIRSI